MLNALIIGCGDIGVRVGGRLKPQGYGVSAVVRSGESSTRLRTRGFDTTISNLDQPHPELTLCDGNTLIFYFAPPPSSGDTDPRMKNFLGTLSNHSIQPAGILYISTTAVYGERDGNWVDEATPTHPIAARGKRRLDAESQLREYHRHQQVPVTILRVAAIYSANRLPLKQIEARTPILKLEEAPYSNRIHADDLAEICIAAAQFNRDRALIFNVSDGNPGSISQYYQQVAQRFDLPSPPLISLQEAEQQLSPGMLSYLRESKRIDNRRMLDTLRVSLRYPTLEEGLRQCVAELSDCTL